MLRGLGGHAGDAQKGEQRDLRTHMMFSRTLNVGDKKRVRRKGKPGVHVVTHHNVNTQTVGAEGSGLIDPTEWSGNQRILHYGPLANKDPFFYYYPKGWDILYPAQFGFFPYRTKRFQGSTPMVCLSAFGAFFIIGGGAMTFLGFLLFAKPDSINAMQPVPKRSVTEKSPYLPPAPPLSTVLVNAHTEASLYTTDLEAKLYPPSIPGFDTMSTITGLDQYYGSPYNTLSTYNAGGGSIYENAFSTWSPDEYNLGTFSVAEDGLQYASQRPTPQIERKRMKKLKKFGTYSSR